MPSQDPARIGLRVEADRLPAPTVALEAGLDDAQLQTESPRHVEWLLESLKAGGVPSEGIMPSQGLKVYFKTRNPMPARAATVPTAAKVLRRS